MPTQHHELVRNVWLVFFCCSPAMERKAGPTGSTMLRPLRRILAPPDTPCLTPYPHVSGDLRHMPECLVRDLNV